MRSRPTRFQFTSDKLIYPLKITQISVKEKTEALFYVQAPLQGRFASRYELSVSVGAHVAGGQRLHARWSARQAVAIGSRPSIHKYRRLLRRDQELGFTFVSGQRPQPEQARSHGHHDGVGAQLTEDDIAVLRGRSALQRRKCRMSMRASRRPT